STPSAKEVKCIEIDLTFTRSFKIKSTCSSKRLSRFHFILRNNTCELSSWAARNHSGIICFHRTKERSIGHLCIRGLSKRKNKAAKNKYRLLQEILRVYESVN